MYEDATLDNVYLYINKAYTKYKDQNKLYRKNRSYYEKAGFSEAQTGLTIEISYNKWLDENAYKYGFILRYPKDKEYLTGYYRDNYYRYVGIDVATFIHNNNISYEEYYAYFIEQK
jgi:D-alanyl-D-alanine carboxypeptidase